MVIFSSPAIFLNSHHTLYVPTVVFWHLSIVINGVGWLDDCYGPSPILHDSDNFCLHWSTPLLTVFIYSNFHWQLVTFVYDGFLYCLFVTWVVQNNIKCINSWQQLFDVTMSNIFLGVFRQVKLSTFYWCSTAVESMPAKLWCLYTQYTVAYLRKMLLFINVNVRYRQGFF